ncbi:MAG: Tim44 domain-containing protein [Oxalobacteraceae bacterium]
MKKLWMALIIAILGVSLGMDNAEAKRLGGGGSFGKSSPSAGRPAPMQQSGQQAAPAARPAQPAAPAPAPSSPWKGILGGALLGLGIGALLSHFGMGAEFASMLGSVLMIALIAIAGLFIFRMLTRKSSPAQPEPAYAGAGAMERSITPEIGSNLGQTGAAPAPLDWQSGQAASVPEGFDTPGFLRHSKTNFIRMQAAWDKADVNDIREFTTPEMFAELKMQLTERGASSNHTDVVSLDAELLGIETTSDEYIASIRFSGMVREAEHAPAEAFSEIWVLAKPVSGTGGWLLAGLQQT